VKGSDIQGCDRNVPADPAPRPSLSTTSGQDPCVTAPHAARSSRMATLPMSLPSLLAPPGISIVSTASGFVRPRSTLFGFKRNRQLLAQSVRMVLLVNAFSLVRSFSLKFATPTRNRGSTGSSYTSEEILIYGRTFSNYIHRLSTSVSDLERC
jgi:hypothetical protein